MLLLYLDRGLVMMLQSEKPGVRNNTEAVQLQLHTLSSFPPLISPINPRTRLPLVKILFRPDGFPGYASQNLCCKNSFYSLAGLSITNKSREHHTLLARHPVGSLLFGTSSYFVILPTCLVNFSLGKSPSITSTVFILLKLLPSSKFRPEPKVRCIMLAGVLVLI